MQSNMGENAMDRAFLVINAGSSSIKFAVFCDSGNCGGKGEVHCRYRGQIEEIGQDAHFRATGSDAAPLVDAPTPAASHAQALATLLDWVENHAGGLQWVAAGHRVVHGGVDFHQPVIVDDNVLDRLKALVPLAPLHQPHNLSAIRALREQRPLLPQVACFDTAFHHSLPPVEQSFALPRELTEAGLRPYGFHGLSYEYIAGELPGVLGATARGRVIVAHLGHGASLCALHDCRSIATTMTFTPLDGLPMATRCGSIDPAVILYLLRERGMDSAAISELLNFRSGLLGLSGISGDVRVLLADASPQAAQAIELFVHHTGRALGSLAAALGGLDALVFTAGIGEHSACIRAQICHHAAWLGVQMDDAANEANRRRISTAESAVSVWVIPTNEELMIARHTQALTART